MKIETVSKSELITTERQIVRYSDKEIEELILSNLKDRGTKASSVKFVTDYKYMTDEWGMNSHIVVEFEGAIVELERSCKE